MQQGTIVNLHIARVKETPSDPVDEATAVSGKGLEGDRSCSERNMRQVLFMDKETLDRLRSPSKVSRTPRISAAISAPIALRVGGSCMVSINTPSRISVFMN